jgi:hypothetical protein
VLELDCDELVAQFFHFEPMALRNFKTTSTTNYAAWKTAVLATQKKASTRANHRADVLVQCLARYGAWTSSSSDVERGFAQSVQLKGGKSEDLHTSREESLMILRCDPMTDGEKTQIMKEAVDIWMDSYGRPRVHKTRRIDRGRLRCCATEEY